MRIQLLGPMTAHTSATGRPVDLGPRKQRAVLAALLCDVGQAVSVDELLERVWERPPKAARSTLYAHLSRLRRVFAEGATKAGLRRTGSGYAIDVPREWVDVLLFQDLAREGSHPRVTGERRAAVLREALEQWHGTPLADLHTVWAAGVRDSWELQRTTAAALWSATEIDLGRPDAVIPVLTGLLPSRPLAESLVYELMRALCATGQTAEALDWYARTRVRLADELGSDPGPALRELHMSILEDTAQGRVPTRAAEFRAWGDPAVPSQLPAYAPSFTGRTSLLRRLDGFVDAEQRTIVISGEAGVGKTTLATYWAYSIRDRFPDGQLYVNLHGFSSQMQVTPAAALASFLRALGVPPQEVPLDTDDASALFRSAVADKQILILLDNAASADQIRPLLPGSAHCLTVATSRNRLSRLVARDGARRLSLEVMTEEEAVELLEVLLTEYRAVDDNILRDLAIACGRLPLALRICAASLSDRPNQPLADFVHALHAGDRLAALTVTDDDQIAVHSAFDLSYQALSETAKRLFTLIGGFPGSEFRTGAVAALADMPPSRANEILDQLAAIHMIHEVAADRYTFHDLIRLYAERCFATGLTAVERHDALRRLCEYYLASIDTAARLLYPQIFRLPIPPAVEKRRPMALTGPREAKAWLDGERSNLVALTKRAAEQGLPELAWLMADALRGYLNLQQAMLDWFAIAETGLAAAVEAGDPIGQAAAHHSLANASHSVSRYEAALEHLASAKSLSASGGWSEGHTAALCNLGNVYVDLGMLHEAVSHYSLALEANQRAGSMVGTAVNLGNLGEAYQYLHDLEQAVGCYQAALDLYTEIGSPQGRANMLTNLGSVCGELGDPAAERDVIQGLEIHREIGNEIGEAIALTGLARIRCASGRPAAAIECARNAIAIHEKFSDRAATAGAHSALAEALAAVGEHTEAIGEYEIAQTIATTTRIPYQETIAALGLARLRTSAASGEGDAAARAMARKALRTARRAGFRNLEEQALTLLERLGEGPPEKG